MNNGRPYSRRFILNYSRLLSVSWGFWSDTPLMLALSLSCHNTSPQLFHFSCRDEGRRFVPLHHTAFTSLSLIALVAYWVVYGECLCLYPCVRVCLPWPVGLRTLEANDVLVFANKTPTLQNVKVGSTQPFLWSGLVSIEMHVSYYGLSGVIIVIQADTSLYWEKCAILYSILFPFV